MFFGQVTYPSIKKRHRKSLPTETAGTAEATAVWEEAEGAAAEAAAAEAAVEGTNHV
jgi:hypothetical protein